MKTNSNFKIDKQVKRFMATMLDPVKRHEFKRMMIDAEHFASIVPKISKKERFTTSTPASE